MTIASTSARYRAISIDVVAYVGGSVVEAHIRTDTGKTIVLFCEANRVPAIRHRIDKMQHAFPGMIAMSSTAASEESPRYWARTARTS
jgi:hypothetical protein